MRFSKICLFLLAVILVFSDQIFAAEPEKEKASTEQTENAETVPNFDLEMEDESESEIPSPVIAAKGKTGVNSIDSLPTYEWDVSTNHQSLPVTLMLGICPVGGQYYTGHSIRGGFITAVELALTYEVFINKKTQKRRRFKQAREYQDSVMVYTKRILHNRDSLIYFQKKRNQFAEQIRDYSDHKIEEEDLRKSELTWLIGVHIYSLFDAYGIWVNNQGHSVEYRPVLGTLLRSFVPGWGQIYNREYGKAGLLYMGLLGASVSMASRQHVINYYLDRKHALEKEDPTHEDMDKINEQILYYRKNRNQYIWGMVLIYLYSIGDAVVDAMMSDFDSPAHFALGPDFQGGISAAITFDF